MEIAGQGAGECELEHSSTSASPGLNSAAIVCTLHLQMAPQAQSPLDISTSVVPSPEVLVQELDGEAVLLNLESERYFGLDDVGTRVWQHLLEHRRLDRVCEEMQKEYDVDGPTLRADVLRLVAELVEAGIVIVQSPEAADAGNP